MPELYRLTDWSADGSSANLGAYDDLDPEMQSIVMGLAQRIYDGEKITYDPDLLQATVKPYLDGIAKGYGKTLADVDWNTPDAKTLQKLTENVFQFSASKDFHILSDMTAALKGSDGKMRSFDEFRAEVDKMNVKYNQNWLRTEYNQAVASSQCAARWTDFEKHAKSMPFLQYQAVMDGNTRAEHAALNGVIKRVDSDFWDKYYPPNGWGCRCEVIQLPGKNHKETPAEAIKFCKVDDMWKVNVGKKGVVFPKGHPYFMQRCKGCNGPNLSLGYDETNPQCHACFLGMKECKKETDGCLKKAEQKEIYKRVLEYGKTSIIGKIEYPNESFPNGKKAIFVKNSFTESLKYGELFNAKVDVFNNLPDYLSELKKLTPENPTHDEKQNLAFIYKGTVKYKGDVPEGIGRDIELQFKEYRDGRIVFYFVKFL